MGAGCAHFEGGQLSYVKFCAKSPDFLPEVSGNGSQSQMRSWAIEVGGQSKRPATINSLRVVRVKLVVMKNY
jgi:hypothetical protein